MNTEEFYDVLRSARKNGREISLQYTGATGFVTGPVTQVTQRWVRIGVDPTNPKSLLQIPLHLLSMVSVPCAEEEAMT